MDMHFPEPDNERRFKEAFRSFAYHRGLGKPYPIPYRCLYSKDIPNLFVGGRAISCSHVAFASIRVMRTLGQLGEVIGMAAGLCKQYACLPADIYHTYLKEFKQQLEKGVSSKVSFQNEYVDMEGYHFADAGWLFFYPYDWVLPPEKFSREIAEKFRRNIRAIGLSHKYSEPEILKE
jgi:hypothetical protein